MAEIESAGNLTGHEEVQARLAKLDMPAQSATLAVLADQAPWLGQTLDQAERGDADALRRIAVALRAASPTTQGVLNALAIKVKFDDLMRVGGRDFFRLVQDFAGNGGMDAGPKILQALCVEPAVPATQVPAAQQAAANAPSMATQDEAPLPANSQEAERLAELRTRTVHVYGSKGALSFASAVHPKTLQPVLMIDAAESRGGRQYEWLNKITMQMTFGEMVSLYGVLVGLTQGGMETAVHGASGKKFRIDDQDSVFFVRLSVGRRTVAVPVSPMDALQVALLISNCILQQQPQLKDMDGLTRFVSLFISRIRPGARQTAA